MKATFKGVPGEPEHSIINMYGQEFVKGQAVDLKDMTPQYRAKLRNHPHFEVQDDPADKKEEDAIRKEFAGAGNASLADVEARQVQDEQDAIARSRSANQAAGLSTEENPNGGTDPERTGQPATGQAAGTRQGGSGSRGR